MGDEYRSMGTIGRLAGNGEGMEGRKVNLLLRTCMAPFSSATTRSGSRSERVTPAASALESTPSSATLCHEKREGARVRRGWVRGEGCGVGRGRAVSGEGGRGRGGRVGRAAVEMRERVGVVRLVLGATCTCERRPVSWMVLRMS